LRAAARRAGSAEAAPFGRLPSRSRGCKRCRHWRPIIWRNAHASVEIAVACCCRGRRLDRRAGRRAGEDPRLLGGAGVELGLDPVGEEGPRQASRQVLRARAGALSGHAADDHRDGQRRARDRQPRLFDARHRDPERRPRRHPRDRRRVPRRHARPLHSGIPRARRRTHRRRTVRSRSCAIRPICRRRWATAARSG
jgi:hypothetical protein